MTENKKFESKRYLYREADVYTPYTSKKPKLHEMGYFTDNIESFDNLNDPNLDYVYGELTDYNDDCERRYHCEGAEFVDAWLTEVSLDGNYAFYIPENSIPQEKREWYKNNATNNVR